jgi:hypothetical protein
MAGKIRKATGIFLLILAIMISQIPPTIVESSAEIDFQMNGDILVRYTGTEETVSVPDGVKEIGEEAFSENSSIKKVILPNSVEKIKYNAFFGCENLEEIDLNDELLSIGSSAFSNCKKLVEISIGISLNDFGSGVFAGCDALETLNLDSKNEIFSYEDGVLYSKDKSTLYEMLSGRKNSTYQMPDTVTKINQYAFWGCDYLLGITLSNNLKKIEPYTFANCTYLTGVSIPYSVTTIEERAFQDCRNLGELSIPESVTMIHVTAFEGCYNLSIKAKEGTAAYQFLQTFNITDADKAEQEDVQENEVVTTEISDDIVTESSLTTDTGILLGQTKVASRRAVVFIDNSSQTVYTGNSFLEQVDNQIPENEGIQQEEAIIDSDFDNEIENNKGVYIPKYAIINNQIADFAFYGNQNLDEYQLDQAIHTIGQFSFARTNLYEIKIPEGVEVIEQGAFYHCNQLYQVEIPSSVKKIEKAAFANTPFFSNWVNQVSDSDFLIVGDGVLIGYKGNSEKVNVPNQVKTIGPEVFMDHTEIQSVILPDSLEIISEDAFANCSNLSILLGGSFVTQIEDRAFYGTALESIRISSDVISIGLMAFADTNINLENNGINSTIVFHGESIPTINYNESATRFSNLKYRNPVFDQATLALVDDFIQYEELSSNTVLTDDAYGYHGLIGSIQKDANFDEPGLIIIKYDTSTKYTDGSILYPNEIILYGDRYFLEYSQMKVISSANNSDNSNEKSDVLNILNNTALFPLTDKISASILNSNSKYHFILSEVPETSTQLKDAFLYHYQDELEKDVWMEFELQVFDQSMLIPIRKFGDDKLTITLPVSDTLAQEYLRLVTVDQDGQLEEIPLQIMSENDLYWIQFKVQHLSPFALYVEKNNNQGLNQKNVPKTFLSSRKDESPETGDWNVNTKWFLIVGLVSVSLILMLYKGRRVNKISELH